MNILFSSTKMLDQRFLEELSSLPDTSIFLAISEEDSQRIIKEVNPEIVIINEDNSGSQYAKQVCFSHPDLEVYLYRMSRTNTPQLKCCNSDIHTVNPKLAEVLPMYMPSNHKHR